MRKRVIALALSLIILGIAAYVYSSFHRHDPLSNAQCSFAQFEHGASLEGAGRLQFVPALEFRWRHNEDAGARCLTPESTHEGGRAPPRCA